MKSQLGKLVIEQRRILRFMLRGSLVGAFVSYLVLVPAKISGHLPHPMYNWWFIALAPLAYSSLLLGGSWLCCRLDLRRLRIEEERGCDHFM